jgi:hypothetical protein
MSNNNWIDANDRLPEAGNWYLCASKGCRYSEIVFFDGENEHGIHWLQNGDYLEKVTHWQPLPSPPKQKDGE